MQKNYLAKLFAVAIMTLATVTMANAQFMVDAPASIAGTYNNGGAAFGPQFSGFSGMVVPATDVDGATTACVDIDNSVADVTGAIALVDRGACSFVAKALSAQAAGAIGVIVCNNDTDNPDDVITIGGADGCMVTIPAIMLSYNDCQTIRMESGVMATYTAPGLPGAGESFETSIEIPEGTYTVDSITGTGGIFNGSVGAAWYKYTPSADGVARISSCGSDASTRLILTVSPGGCVGDVQIVAFNVAAGPEVCPDNESASELESLVFAGQDYYIVWDDAVSADGFDFVVELLPLPVVPITFTVNMELEAVSADGVNMVFASPGVSDVGDVSVVALSDNGDGTWSGTADLGTLDTIGYAFVNGAVDPANLEAVPNECGVESGFGFNVRPFVNTAIVPAELAPVCFNLCTNCPLVNVTYTVDMTNEGASADGVSMVVGGPGVSDVGDVELFDMTDNMDGTWSVTIARSTGDTLGYAFLNGALDPANLELVPEECGLASGFGFNIRPQIVEGFDDFAVDVVCFSECGSCPLDEPTCEEPNVLIFEDFEGQTVGEEPTSDFIIFWPTTTSLGTISDEVAASGTNSHRITGTGADVDPVYLLADENITSGHYIVSWQMLVPSGNLGYYNFQKDVTPGTEWAFQLYFDGDGTGRLEAGSASAAEPRATFTYPVDEFFPIVHVVDVDNNLVRVHVNGRWVSSWPLTYQPFATTGLQSFAGVNFYPANTDNLWFVDDFLFAEIPAPGDGLYCQTATSIDVGTHTVADLTCFGAGIFYDVDDDSGLQSAWYSYTAAEDGYITVSSCDAPADTRAYVLGGSCDNPALLGFNDDRCLMSTGDPYATLFDVPVAAGETYYIVWDDYWDALGFDFELTLTPGALPANNFCASAEAVDVGVHTTEGFGEASVGSGMLGASTNPASAVFAPAMYSGAAWFSYTPSEDQTIVITSCDSGEDTYLTVYTGTCDNVGTLTEVAVSDNDCANSSTVEIEVTAGTTYYIEWMDLDAANPFEWEILVNDPAITASFAVDATLLVDAGEFEGTMFIAGTFSNFENIEMSDADGDNVWTVDVLVDPNTTHEYKFKNGPEGWENIDTGIGEDCTIGGYGNRFFDAGETDISLDEVCFAYCVTCIQVSVDDLTLQEGVEVFPNPAKDMLNIRVDLAESADNLSIRMLNAFGQVVSEQYFGQYLSGNIEIDLTDIPAGAYMIQVRDGNAQYTQSVVVQK